MTLLITGIAGFIGCNYVYYYLNKDTDKKIIGLDKLTYAGNIHNLSNINERQKKSFTFIKGDITDKKCNNSLFQKYDIDGVINFAAESHVDRSIRDSNVFLSTNIMGTHTLLETCKDHWFHKGSWDEGTRFLQISTDEVYGSLGNNGKFTELSTIDPRSPYSASKAAADLIVKSYHYTYDMPVLITRSSNNYGPYQLPEKLIPLMIQNALEHKPLPVYGDGGQIRDWLYVLDNCKAIDLVFENGKPGQAYNIGGNCEMRNINLVKTIIKLLQEETQDPDINENLISYVADRLGHDRRYAIDYSKIKNELGWEPEVKFEDGIIQTIRWYLSNEKWLKKIKIQQIKGIC